MLGHLGSFGHMRFDMRHMKNFSKPNQPSKNAAPIAGY